MGILREFTRKISPNPLDRIIRKAKGRRFLLCWNRGLGDIALGLYAIVRRIRELSPAAEITFLTREDLRAGFAFLERVKVLTAPSWKRGSGYSVDGDFRKSFDVIIENPDPTYWVKWQLGNLVPKMLWKEEYDQLCEKFALPPEYEYIGAQPQGESGWGGFRSWPEKRWKELFAALDERKNTRVILLGIKKEPLFHNKCVMDLRGETNLFELFSLMKNKCGRLILPDSGILSLFYYLDASFSVGVISLWADPGQGILKQGVPSPNRRLYHKALIGKNGNIGEIRTEEVLKYV